MRILQVNKFFYKKGGSEIYFFALRELLRQKGHEVMDFSMHHERNEVSRYQKYFIKPINFDGEPGLMQKIKNSFHLLYSFEAARNLELLIKNEGRPDVAHLHNFSYQLTPSIIKVLKKHKIPIVWTLHDYKLISPNYNLYTRGQIDLSTKPDKYFRCLKNKCVKNSWAKSFLAAMEIFLHRKVTRLYDKVDIYISPSKFLQNLIVEWGIKKEKVCQLYNFIDFKNIAPSTDHENYYLYVGRLTEEKGVMSLLEAFTLMPERPLKIIGSGPMEQAMHDYIAHHDLPHVEMLGAIYQPALYDVVRKAKVMIIPSVWLENNPIVILEAMACGKPVIGANIGGIPELIDDKKTGLLYEAGNQIALESSVLEIDNYDLAEMSKQAHLKVEQLADPEKHYENLMKIYQEVIDI